MGVKKSKPFEYKQARILRLCQCFNYLTLAEAIKSNYYISTVVASYCQ